MVNLNKESIKREIKNFLVKEFAISPNHLNKEVSLMEEGWLDSYGVVKLVMFIENSFGVEVSLEEINPETLQSIESSSEFIWQKISKKQIQV